MLPIVISLLVIVVGISAYMMQKTEIIQYTKPLATKPFNTLAILFTESDKQINDVIDNMLNRSTVIRNIGKNISDVVRENEVIRDEITKEQNNPINIFVKRMQTITWNKDETTHYEVDSIVCKFLATEESAAERICCYLRSYLC